MKMLFYENKKIKELIHILFRGSQRSSNIKKNIVGSFLIKGFSILIQLILVPLTLGYLNTDLYGIWLTVSSILMWLGFFDIGFTLGLRNKLSEALANGDILRGRKLVSTTYAIMFAIFFPLCVILECIVPFVNWSMLLNVATVYNEEISQVMQILVVSFCLQMVLNVLGTVLTSFQKVAISGIFPVVGNFLSVIVIYILTKTTQSSMLDLAITVSYLPIFVLCISSIYMFRHSLSIVSPNWKYIEFSLVKDLFSLGIKFFVIQVQMLVMYQATNILISNVSNPANVTAYNIAYRYIGTALMLFTLVVGPLWPAFTEAYTKSDFAWMSHTYKKMVRLYRWVVLLIFIMVVFSPIVYQVWIGNSDIVPWSMSVMVGLYTLSSSWDSLQVNLINGIGKIKLQSYITLIGLFLHIPLSLFLGKYIGALGVVTSMLLINMTYAIFFTIQINKIINKRAVGIWNK